MIRQEFFPHDHLMRVSSLLFDAIESLDQDDDIQCIIFLSDSSGGTISMHNVDNDDETIMIVSAALAGFCQANGKQISVKVDDL